MMGTKRICEFDTNTDSLRGVQNMMSTKQITQTTNTLYV